MWPSRNDEKAGRDPDYFSSGNKKSDGVVRFFNRVFLRSRYKTESDPANLPLR
jgi:hypothetical protein